MKFALRFAVADFSLEVDCDLPSAGITVVAGPSGSGKTSLLRCLAGFNRGQGLVQFGKQIFQDQQVFIAPEQRRIGYVTQQTSLFSHLSVAKNLAFALKRAKAGGPELEQVIEAFGIEHLLTRQPNSLSGGEAARVNLARSIVSNPRILLLDEPFSAIDEEAKIELTQSLQKIIQALQIPVLMVVHDFSSITRLADHLIYLEQGMLRNYGPVSELLIDPKLPFARREDACVLVAATLCEQDQKYQLSQLDLGGHTIFIPALQEQIGAQVRLRIRAADVSISHQCETDSSIINSLPVTILQLRTDDEALGQVLAVLDAKGFQLLARLTQKSVAELNLAVGDQLFARLKASAMMQA